MSAFIQANILILLHPFIPFFTEKVWQEISILYDEDESDENDEKMEISGDEIIKMPDGSLTTIYHFIKNSNMKIDELLTINELQEINQ